MSFYMPSAAASSSLRQAGLAFRNSRIQTAKSCRRGQERRGDDNEAKAKHDSPARKRSVSGSGDDAA